MRPSSQTEVPRCTPQLRRQPRHYRFRAFYITVLCISCFAVLSLVTEQFARQKFGDQYGIAQRRALEGLDVNRLVKRDEECRLVHFADDKCAFIKANCPDEEAGLVSYLSFYYCDFQKVQWIAFIILSAWLALLFTSIGIAASDFFCPNLSTIASILGMSQSMAGVTFLAFGNGSPDVFSTFAAMSSHSGSLAIGELIGAAGFITAVVAGSMALVREFKVGKKTFVRDVGFFIVAASFSMMFLADGHLHLWECCVMVGFYVFYVVVVVVWHWYLSGCRRRREREAAARGQYLAIANEELEITEEGDEDDEDSTPGERRYRDIEDFDALERGSPAIRALPHEESDEDGEAGVNLAAEMANSMRVTRPKGRRNTITPIRPSLVGALEFRSVLSSLQKSQGSLRPIHLRRYSDDAGQHDGAAYEYSNRGRYSDTESGVLVTPAEDLEEPVKTSTSGRGRAVSMNDAALLNPAALLPSGPQTAPIPNIGIVAATPTFLHLEDASGPNYLSAGSALSPIPPSPTISLSPPPSTYGSRDSSPKLQLQRKHGDTLAPPVEDYPGAHHVRVDMQRESQSTKETVSTGPLLTSGIRSTERPRLHIPGSASKDSSHSLSPVYQFPAYTDSPLPMSAVSSRAPSLMLPESGFNPDSEFSSQDDEPERIIKWWPYHILPSPYTLASALFPTLYSWHNKTWWDKIIGLVSAPTIFIFAVTLPVVDSENQEPEDMEAAQEIPTPNARPGLTSRTRSGTGPILAPESPAMEPDSEWQRYRRVTENQARRSHSPHSHSSHHRGFSGHSTAAVAVSAESNGIHHQQPTPLKRTSNGNVSFGPESHVTIADEDWNRWLVIVQIFTAPLFVILIIWANSESTKTRLVAYILFSLGGSAVALLVLIFTTTPLKPPKYRFILCFLGFVVAIAWISTIANEVVGVLKALGVILGISDAILGLTIFAVGNSLGDLVADITVANLGYPVMALSACFGGPMLNILLGIGISGMYMTVSEANHKHLKHPEKQLKYEPYQIEVSGTLMISAVTLLITLVGLLIAVPMNNWMMTRRIGWGLIGLWVVSTIVNVGVEVSGVWGKTV